MAFNLNTLKTVALALGIIIVLNAFINIGVKTFYSAPELEDSCSAVEGKVFSDRVSCEEVDGQWILPGESIKGEFRPRPVPVFREGGELEPYCDAFAGCREIYQDARSVYDRNVFIILIIAGLIALAIGYNIAAAEAVSSGFVFGGVLSFIIGTLRYWSNMDDNLRFIVLGVALIILIWIGYKKLKS